jgi:acyloxyacyl hydrolase
MNSIYQRLRAQNLCNHRQFANIGVNGARVTSMSPPGGIIESFTPDAALDAPSLVIHALIGNDVCNGHPGTSAMTTVEEFQAAVLASLDYLDANLPAGSHVAFLGLVDGRILFDTTKSRIHPLGVTYPALYDYLGCTGSSPCLGWLNTNETMRNITSERAANLTKVYDDIIAVNGSAYKNFDLYRLQVDWPELIANYTAHGGDAINVIEPVVRAHALTRPPLLRRPAAPHVPLPPPRSFSLCTRRTASTPRRRGISSSRACSGMTWRQTSPRGCLLPTRTTPLLRSSLARSSTDTELHVQG